MNITKQMIERDDRYIIPLQSRVVSRCYVDTALGIQFFENGPQTTIRVTGGLSVVKEGQEQKFYSHEFEHLGDIFSILGKAVVSATALKNGRLEILFEDDIWLLVDSDPKYETWELSASDGLQLVSLPGGDLAVWSAVNK